MNKSAIKNFAVNARKKLIQDIEYKAYELGIEKDAIKEIETFEGGFKIEGVQNGKIFKKHEKKQREDLVARIHEKGFQQVMEEVSYTWFNRFIAIRFMEINGYLPSGVRVLSSQEEGKVEPDIISEVEHIDLDLKMDVVYRLLDSNDTDDLYRYLIVKQCNKLGEIMPYMFERIADYTELLLPDNLLSENSIIRDLIDSIEEDDFKDEVEIIGWLYQYYISEKKDEVFAGLKKNKKITKENIPAATQLFTPKWIVKYMVENSLGRLWLESHPDEDLKSQWKYYLEEADQEPEVKEQLEKLRNNELSPEDIKVLDPAMGSGHILVYAFDVLYEIYLSAGYREREIPSLILEKNIYGLDIDDRAGQLAYFALMMKARSKNRRIFRKRIETNVCSIQESNGISKEAIAYFANGNEKLQSDVEYIAEVFEDAKEYGSILNVEKVDFDAMDERIEEIRDSYNENLEELVYKNEIIEKLPELIRQGRIMSEKYDVMCTNPPYMGRKGMNPNLIKYVDENFKDSKSDLFSVFMELDETYVKNNGFLAMINQHSWMFLSSFEKLRSKIIKTREIYNMLHLGPRAFEEIGGEVVQSTAFVNRKSSIDNYDGTYFRLVDLNNTKEKEEKTLELIKKANDNCGYIVNSKDFSKIPGNPISYWVNNKIKNVFDNNLFFEYSISDGQNKTGNNEKFVRLFWEVNKYSVGIDKKWFFYAKGGGYRKWYGNLENVVNWSKEARDHYKKDRVCRIIPEYLWYKKGITWGLITSNLPSFRILPEKATFDVGGSSIFLKEYENYDFFLGLLNSAIYPVLAKILNPTLNFQVKDIRSIPIIFPDKQENRRLRFLTEEATTISKTDWDSFETSWDFKKHPLLKYKEGAVTIEESFKNWAEFAESQFNQLKANEEELNRIFIDIYGLEEELTPEVEDKDVTVSKADEGRDIKSFISYAVGCMFGRYSLDEEGLIFAGGEFDKERYKSFKVEADNVIAIADDVYFEEDIVSRFVDFLALTFGEEKLEENIDYIAEILKKKASETSRQAIRRYFMKDFYKDHVKRYKKKPIYWMFESGKQDGFKALIYMHRYDPSTVARVRTEYLHQLQKKYDSEKNRLDMLIESDASAREKSAAKKRKDKIIKQIAECVSYDQAMSHVANKKIEIDLDDGVTVNYAKFQDTQVSEGEGKKAIKMNLLAKI